MPEFMNTERGDPLFFSVCHVVGEDHELAAMFRPVAGPMEVECKIGGIPVSLNKLMGALNAGWERQYKSRAAKLDEEVEKRAKALIEGTVLQDAYYKLEEVTQGVLNLVKDFTAAEKAAWEVIVAREGDSDANRS